MCAMITCKPLWGQGEGVDQEQADLDFSRIAEALPFLSPLSPHQRKPLGSWPPASLGHTCSDRSMTWNKLPSSPPSVIIGKFPVHRQLPVRDEGCLLAGFLWVVCCSGAGQRTEQTGFPCMFLLQALSPSPLSCLPQCENQPELDQAASGMFSQILHQSRISLVLLGSRIYLVFVFLKSLLCAFGVALLCKAFRSPQFLERKLWQQLQFFLMTGSGVQVLLRPTPPSVHKVSLQPVLTTKET